MIHNNVHIERTANTPTDVANQEGSSLTKTADDRVDSNFTENRAHVYPDPEGDKALNSWETTAPQSRSFFDEVKSAWQQLLKKFS